MAADVAGQVADRFGGTYDEALAFGWLDNNARIAAENTNNSTFSSLVAAFAPTTGTASRSKDISPRRSTSPKTRRSTPVCRTRSRPRPASSSRLLAGLADLGDLPCDVDWQFRPPGGRVTGRRSVEGVGRQLGQLPAPRNRWRDGADGRAVLERRHVARRPIARRDQVAGCTCSLDFTTEAA
jgi:hypothetical protein